MMGNFPRAYIQNYRMLRALVNRQGASLERQPYTQFASWYDGAKKDTDLEHPLPSERIAGHTVEFVAQVPDRKPNGDLFIEVEITKGLPTLFGVEPGYHFWKRPDGSVYY